MSRSKEIHVKQLEGLRCRHDCLRGMLGPRHLSSFAGTTQMIFLELDALDAYDVFLLRESVQVPHASMP